MVKRNREDAELEEEKSEEIVSTKVTYNNRQRILILCSRGIIARYRHLVEDFKKMIPHHKTDNKLDSKGDIHMINEIADIKSCNQILYLECRKHSDLYLYLGKAPQGPSAKFHVVNIHTMEEMKLTGNCMLGSRPLLNFDSKFNTSPHWQVMKSLFTDAFGTPRGHPKSKPFVDRIMSFYVLNNNIWVRNYQIVDKTEENKSNKAANSNVHLVEIGPRFVLIPIRIFNGSLGGATLYQNSAYVSPNEERSQMKKHKGDRYKARLEHEIKTKQMMADIQPEPNQLSNTLMFKEK